jgi:transposase-like protein
MIADSPLVRVLPEWTRALAGIAYPLTKIVAGAIRLIPLVTFADRRPTAGDVGRHLAGACAQKTPALIREPSWQDFRGRGRWRRHAWVGVPRLEGLQSRAPVSRTGGCPRPSGIARDITVTGTGVGENDESPSMPYMKEREPAELTLGERWFSDQSAAREFLEKVRWPHGPICPHCGAHGAYRLRPKAGSRRPVRRGVLKCRACRRQFAVTVGTIFENSHIPLSKWLVSIQLLCASRDGIGASELRRVLGVSYKSAWFMARRLRHAIARLPLSRNGAGDGTHRGRTGKAVRSFSGVGRQRPGDPPARARRTTPSQAASRRRS